MNLEQETKQPSEVDPNALHEIFKAQQEGTNKENPPTIAAFRQINPDPRTKMNALANKFNTIAFEWYFNEWINTELLNDQRLKDFKEELIEIQRNYRKIGVQKAEAETIAIIKKALKADKVNLRFLNMFGVEFYDPTFILLGVSPGPNAKITGYELEQDIFKSSMSTSDKITELKGVFDVDIDLNLFVVSGDQLVIVPNTENLADWLDKNHFSEDCKIIALPANGLSATIKSILAQLDYATWSEADKRLIKTYWIQSDGQLHETQVGALNPNLPHYMLFRDEVRNILYDNDLTSKLTYGALEEVAGRGIRDSLDYMGRDPSHERYTFKPDRRVLDTVYGNIKASVIFKFANDRDKQNEIMYKVDQLFNLQYKIFGLVSQNRFYKPASQTFNGWLGVLKKHNIPNINSLKAISLLMGHTAGSSLSYTLRRLNEGGIHMQESSTIEEYINIICSKTNLKGSNLIRLRQDLEIIAEPYLTAIKAVEYKDPTIEVKIDELRQLFPTNQKLDLIEDIADIIGIPNVEYEKISILLFNDETYLTKDFIGTTGSEPRIKARPYVYNLNWMKDNIIRSDFKIFSDKIPNIDNELIASIKEQLIYKIERWTRSNPYDTPYVYENKAGFKRIYGPEVDNMNFELMNYIWNTFRIYTNNPKLTFVDIQNIVESVTGFSNPINAKSGSSTISEQALQATRSKLIDMIYKETDQTRIILYENTISVIDAYIDILAEKRNVRNVALRPTQKSLRVMFKKDDYIRSYLIMNLLSRDLGFEPVFFDWLEEDLFDNTIYTTGGYALHHMDDQRAWSIYIRDLMITSKRYHGFYLSPSITAQDTNIMQKGLNMLIELGVDRYKQGAANWDITENDINAIFTRLGGGSTYTMSDGRTVLEWWKDGSSTGIKSARSFGDRLIAFNNRIEFLAKNDYEKLINKYYPINGPGWIDFGKVQLKSYVWMMENLKHLHYHVHLEDVDFLRKIGSI